MRTFLVCSAFVLGSLSIASAAETIVHDTTTTVTIDLNDKTVLCSAADYGQLYLKVALPQLAGLTLLNHENEGAGAPCVAAGKCAAGNMPTDILDAKQPTETVAINVKEIRVDATDAAAQTCSTTLMERVDVTIRGKEFKHQRVLPLVDRPFADCVADTGSGGSDKADDPGTAAPSSGGCSTSRGGSSLLLVLGALATLRRRRRR